MCSATPQDRRTVDHQDVIEVLNSKLRIAGTATVQIASAAEMKPIPWPKAADKPGAESMQRFAKINEVANFKKRRNKFSQQIQ